MDYLFEIIDKTSRKLHLTKERWSHITHPSSLHPEMTNYLEEVKITLQKPDKITQSIYDNEKVIYYRYLKANQQYLKVLVKYLNGTGFIISAYFTRNIK